MKIVFPILFSALFLAACAGAHGDPALTGQTWQLVSYGSNEAPIPALTWVDAYMEFNQDGTLSGNLGCNNFTVEYRVWGSSLEFGEMHYPMGVCNEINPVTEQETIVTGFLIGRLEYKISGETLTIWLDSNRLVFRKK